MRKVVVSAVALFFLCANGFAQRLSGDIQPTHYQLTFAPDFATEKFAGETVIDVVLAKPTKTITLNAVDLVFHDVKVTAAGRTQPAKVRVRASDEIADLDLAKQVPAGPAKISIRYTGTLNSKLRGLYLSKANGRKYAVTQMEATDARRAFPSFDEPAYKATFDISAVVDKDGSVLSNAKQISDTREGANKHRVKFATTAKMSTYLVALAVGDWKCSEGEQDGIPLSVCSTPGKEHLTNFGLEATKHIVKYLNEYYGIKYPFGKLDQVAIPDFEAGAMENTGLITYRETYLLVDDKNSTEEKKKFIAEVIAHEIAHQWFGDLVTMKWWDDIWLNEGFASWMATKPVAGWRPDWLVEMDNTRDSMKAMHTDSLANTRPIQEQAEARNDINALFDAIAYEKTAAVLRMIEHYVGEETFRKGINAYLNKYAYGNASAEDFWTIMAQETGKPIDKILASYVRQPGMPYVSVHAQCEGDKTRVEFTQQRYFYDRQKFSAPSDQVWQVPVCFKTADGTRQCELVSQAKQSATLNGCVDIASANADASGFYRYSVASQRPSARSLSEPERLSLLDNEWALVRSGARSVADYLSIAEQLRDDRSPSVVYELAYRYRYIHRYLLNDSDRPEFESWVRSMLSPVMNELGYAPRPNDTSSTNELRSTVLRALALAGGDQNAIAEARRLTDSYLKDEGSVEPSLAEAVVNVAAVKGNGELYDKYLAELRDTKSVDKYYNLFYSLTEFRDPALLQRTLDWALTPEVRNQDLFIIGEVMANPVGGKLAWDFVKAHTDEINKKASENDFGMVTSGLGSLCDAANLADVQQYLSKQPQAETRRMRQSVESIQYCVDLKQQQSPVLANWLRGQGSAGATK